MSDVTYLGRNVRAFESSPEFDGYTKVVITVSDDVEYSAGVETGRTLTLVCPWGTQDIANDILSSIKGFQYQPYSASDAFLDPAAELGDAVTVNNVYGGIYSRTTKFGALCSSAIAAPSEEELDSEYPYISKQERKVSRTLYNLSSELKVQAGLISAEVNERKSDVKTLTGKLEIQAGKITAEVNERKNEVESLRGALSIQAGKITAEVNERKSETESLRSELNIQAGVISAKVGKAGGDYGTFGWNLRGPGEVAEHPNGYFELVSNGYNQIMLADENGLFVNGRIHATGGLIGGFTIERDYLSYNGQTWGGTNTIGGYLGVQGLQLGKNFRVDMMGNLTAYSGKFTGTVYAGNIAYGDDERGYFSGSGISSGSIVGNRMAANTITTSYTSTGINTSLANGNWAANCFSGIADYNASISIGKVSCLKLYQEGYGFTKKSITFKDGDGYSVTIAYWG